MLARPQAVHWVQTEERSVVEPDTHAFEYRPELGWCWLQRLAIAVLAWVGAYRLARMRSSG